MSARILVLLALIPLQAFAAAKKDSKNQKICDSLLANSNRAAEALTTPYTIDNSAFPAPYNKKKIEFTPTTYTVDALLENQQNLEQLQPALQDVVRYLVASRQGNPEIENAVDAGLKSVMVRVTRADFARMVESGVLDQISVEESRGEFGMRLKLVTDSQSSASLETALPKTSDDILLFLDPSAIAAGHVFNVDSSGPQEFQRALLVKRSIAELVKEGRVTENWLEKNFVIARGPFPISALRAVVAPKNSDEVAAQLVDAGYYDLGQAPVSGKMKVPAKLVPPQVSHFTLETEVDISRLFGTEERWSDRELLLMDVNSQMLAGPTPHSQLAKPGFWLSVMGSGIEMANEYNSPIRGKLANVSYTSASSTSIDIHEDDGSTRYVDVIPFGRRRHQRFVLNYNESGRSKALFKLTIDELMSDSWNEFFSNYIHRRGINRVREKIVIIE